MINTYVARTKKEFLRVTQLLCDLNISWVRKSGWNIEIETQPVSAASELLAALRPFAEIAKLQPKPDGTETEWYIFEGKLKNCLPHLVLAKEAIEEVEGK